MAKDILSATFPNLAAEWHTQKNAGYSPTEFTCGSNKKVWWKCSVCGNEWQAAIYTRTNGRGCPVCAKKIRSEKLTKKNLIPGKTDLATCYPDIASQWNREKNEKLLPSEVTSSSSKKVWWTCSLGHDFQMTIANRTSHKQGCPVCANKKLLKGYNDLKTLFPQVAESWNYEKNEMRPEDHIAGTHKKVWWICPDCGDQWKASIKERTYGKTGCPRCTFYHKTSFPEQAIFFYIRKIFLDAVNTYKANAIAPYEIDIFIPSLNLGIEYDGGFWHKDVARDQAKSDKLKESGITLLRMREYGLPIAPKSDLIVECEPFHGEPERLTVGLQQFFQRITAISGIDCNLDIDVERDFPAIKASYEGTKKQRSLAYANPPILTEWNYQKNGDLTPDKVTTHSHTIVWWKCSRCEKEWQQSVKTKVLGGLLCESCSKKDANLQKMKNLTQTNKVKAVASFPHLLQEWDFDANTGLSPEHVTYGSERKVHWVCQACGNHFSMRVKARTIQGQDCPLCRRKKSARTRSKKFKDGK